jgi:transcriptional regulator of acetoin/glycerol metabolism
VSSNEVEEVLLRNGDLVQEQKQLQKLRNQFLSDQSTDLSIIRPELAQSWRRSIQFGLDADCAKEDHLAVPKIDEALVESATPVLVRLSELAIALGGEAYICDPEGTAIPISGLEFKNSLVVQKSAAFASAREDLVGTNSDGTAIETGKSFQVWGAEHFADRYQDVCCTSVPIWDPMRRKLRGLLTLMIPSEVGVAVDRRSILVILESAVSEIQNNLSVNMMQADQALLNAYSVRRRRRGGEAVIALGNDTIIASSNALRHFAEIENGALEALAGITRNSGKEAVGKIQLSKIDTAEVQAQPVFSGPNVIGAIVNVRKTTSSLGVGSQAINKRKQHLWSSPQMAEVMKDAESLLNAFSYLHLTSEKGVDRFEFLHNLSSLFDKEIEILNSKFDLTPEVLFDHVMSLLVRGKLVFLDDLELIDSKIIHSLVEEISDNALEGYLVFFSNQGSESITKVIEQIGSRCLVIPPLRSRRADIPQLVAVILDEIVTNKKFTIHPNLMTRICAAPWSGNYSELKDFIRDLSLHVNGVQATELDIPSYWSHAFLDERLSPLEVAELAVLREAMYEYGSNKLEVANKLQIGRSTLYRKIDYYKSKGIYFD